MPGQQRVSGSFRDPNGFLFYRDGVLYRQINESYRADYEFLNQSGLYNTLVKKGYLIEHEEIELEPATNQPVYKIIKPTLIPYLCYPYEWCFSQLKDAALLTLKIQKQALIHSMSLKDASAYNVQFLEGKAVFIDTLSFEAYDHGPWIAYRQFCQHFLAPLALKSYTDRRLSQLLRTNIDGIPLDLASKLLPKKTWLSFSILAHLHLHARAQTRYADSARSNQVAAKSASSLSKTRLVAMIDQLISAIRRLEPKRERTEWGDYYADTNYIDQAMSHKITLVDQLVGSLQRDDLKIIDMGANNGQFSRVVMPHARYVISMDIDEVAVEKNYLHCKKNPGEAKLLPLVQDLSNPSPAIGWANTERLSLMQRGSVDVILALALIHHIAITNNVPLTDIARFFHQQTDYLVIEFVPKSDSQVQRMLATREDIFDQYQQQSFETIFSEFFSIEKSVPVQHTDRTLYLLKRK